jgi:hypothetical protein
MIDENLIASLGISDDIANSMVRDALGKKAGDEEYMDSLLGQQINDLTPGKLIKGKIIGLPVMMSWLRWASRARA